MGWMDEYNKALKEETKKKKKETKKESSFMEEYQEALDDIAPVAQAEVTPFKPVLDEEGRMNSLKSDGRTWFQKGLFEDGWQFGDLTKTILGTSTDTQENLAAGGMSVGEKVLDFLAGIAPYVTAGQYYSNGGGFNIQADRAFNQAIATSKKGTEEFIKKDLYDEEKVAKAIISDPVKKLTGIDAETDSVLGEKSDALVQSAGQMGAQLALNAVAPGSGMALMGVTAYGGELENALKQGASLEEANLSGAISAGAEILSEKLGGISFGGKTLTDAAFQNLSRHMTGKLSKVLLTTGKITADALSEGGEELFSGYMSAIGQKLTYMEEKEIKELFSSDEALESFIGGVVLGGMGGVGGAVKAHTNGVDYVTGMTKNEQTVVNKLYEDAVAEESKNGKVTEKRKSELYDSIVEQMDKGYISTDTIEEILGGETYKSYSDTVKNEDSLVEQEKTLTEEFNKLNRKPWRDMTGEEHDRLEELKEQLPKLREQIKANEKTGKRKQLKSQLSTEVSELVKGDRLVESYNERIRMTQDFKADFDKYKGTKHEDAAKKTLESAIKAGANNSNRVRDLVELAARSSADTGLIYEFKSGEDIKKDFIARQTAEIAKLEAMERTAEQDQKLQKLKETLAKVESGEVVVNGDISGGNIVLNLDSKKPLNRVVGHEITHSLEPAKGTKSKEYTALKDSLFAYAKTKGIDVDAKLKSLAEQYEGVTDANPEAELVADLVGDFLFTDSKYIQNLSTENRNLFQRLWDEVKYLCKIATAGSQEARELARVQKAFEDAYRESGKKTNRDTTVKHSVSAETDTAYMDAVNRGDTEAAQKMVDEAAQAAGYTIKAYHGTRHGGFTVFDDTKNDLGQKGFFFSDSPEVAKSYFKGSDGTLYSEYIRMDNPLIVDGHRRNWDALKFDIGDDAKAYKIEQRKDGYWEIFNIEGRVSIGRQAAWDTKENAEQAYRNAPWSHPVSTVLNTTRAIVRYAYNKGEYDGVVIKNTVDMGDSRAKRRISTLYIPFKSDQIKSTDPVTYDDSGSVIPLSERFNAKSDDIRYSLSIKHTDGTVEELADARSLTSDQAVSYLNQAKSGSLRGETYIPVRKDTPQVIIDTLAQIGEKVEDRSLVMQVRKAQQAMTSSKVGRRAGKYGNNVRGHSLSPQQIVEIVNKLDDPSAVIYQTNRQDASGNQLPNNVAVFVEYNNNGTEGVAVIEFDSSIDPKSIGTEFGDTSYHTVVTVFEPDVERNGIGFDYAEELLSNPDNIELNIKRRQPEGSATRANQPNTSNELPSFDATVAQNGEEVKHKLSLSDSDGKQLTEEQSEFFKDSKIVDADGNLKVMHHGSPESFTVFDKKKAKASGYYGKGFYFTDSDSHAKQYGNTYDVYLNITNPLQDGTKEITKDQLRKFVEAIAENEDYGIDNYGYDATVDSVTDSVYGKSDFAMLMDINASCVGNMVEAIELFNEVNGTDYNGIVAPTETVAFYPEQIKNIDNLKPTSNPDIRYSLSERSYAEIQEEQQNLYRRERDLMDRKREAENNPELLQAMDDYSNLFSEMRGLLAKRHQGTATQEELNRIDEIKSLREERMKRVADLQERLGLKALSEEADEIRKTKEELRVASDAAWAREGAEKENKAIEKAGVSAQEYFRKKALKAFKTTTNFNEAGYMLPDGKLLNFSGGERNHRYRDHREIGEIYEATNGTDALNRFLSDGNIRIMAESPGIDLASGVEPTREQYAALRKFINTNGVADGQFFVDFSGTDGRRVGNYSYNGRVNAERVLNDIKYFYQNGEVREQSSIGQFLSLSAKGEDIAPMGDFDVYGSDFGVVEGDDGFAPVAENAPTDNAKVAQTEATVFPDDIAPVMDEERNIRLEREKAALDKEFQKRREELQELLKDKNAFVSNRASELYNEIRNLKKGVKASEQLGSLLDTGYEWSAIRSALVNIKYTPGERVNMNSPIESIARQMLNEEYEDLQYELDDLDSEHQKQIKELEKNASASPRTTRKELHSNIVENIRSAFFRRGFDFDDVLKKAKNLSTFATVDNTPQRVVEKSLGYKEGQILNDLTVNQVAQNETEKTKWLNSFTDRKSGLLAQISKQYNIKPGSKKSAAAQMYAEGFYVNENNEIVQYGDAELAADFPDAQVQSNIKGLANDPRIRQIYDETLDMINESRARNLYPEIPRLDNYFLHFRAMDDTFSRLGLPFNPNDIRAKDLPTDLNGVTADLKPGQPYFASAMHRTGKRTSFDLLGGLERYLTSAGNQIYHIDDIQTLRALRNYIADTYGQANGLEGLDELSEEEAQERIQKVYDSHLSTFAKFLNEEANILAGKTALIDRGLEGIIGRRGITFLNSVNKQVGSNMVGFNISSSLTNFLPVAQTFAKSNKFDFVKAFAQTVSNKVQSVYGKGDDFAENSPVVIRRKGADRFYRTPWQKLSDPGYALMGIVDDISTELIARTKYNELTRNGMDSQQAHYETDKWVSRLMGDRSMGQMPQIYNSKMLGLITKFQLEVRNQLDSQFYDTIQEAKVSTEDIQNGLARNAKIAAKVGSTFVQLAVVQHLFGKAFESVAGYNPAFDIIETIITAFGWDDEEEEPVLDNIEEAFLGLLEDLPYTSTFTGGRIPIANALPIKELFTGKDEYGNEKSRLETLGEAAPYYLLPGGYGQIKKTVQGLGMFSDDHPISGSYTDSGKLRFPVEDTLGNKIKAGIFGQYASKNARDYFDNGRSPLAEKQIEEFMSSGMKIQDYWGYREGLSGLSKLSEKADYIDSLDLTDEQKNLFINNIADRKEDIDMSTYGDYDSFEEFDYATKNPEKYDFLTKIGVSYKDFASATDEKGKNVYSDMYTWVSNEDHPGRYDLSKAVTDDFQTFWRYKSELGSLEADKDEDGESINGSKKEKVIDYINNLDLDYGQKIILFRSMYSSKADKNTYNSDIVDYLNSREDISYEEMETILKELGFTVDSSGNISWD